MPNFESTAPLSRTPQDPIGTGPYPTIMKVNQILAKRDSGQSFLGELEDFPFCQV